MTEIERLLIEHACTRMQTLYCIHADNRAVDAFTALFAEDGYVAVPEHPPFKGHAAIRASMQALADLGVTMRHVMSNSLIEAIDADTATGLCYLTAYGSAAPADATGARPMEQPGTVGHYTDEFMRTPQGWRFKSRVLTRVLRKSEDAVQQAARAKAT
ncbi:nuclear transport factor 2 family protein [Terricaulis sp.]|uniref:nuclear transport factor 2 family protein n=1 Tax=Terricaulis sp. TaxID=2768686 RepID=UPI0037836222